jgi:putative membrane protein
MSNSFDFSSFSKQSPKGVLVIYISQLYKLIRFTWVLLFLLMKDFSRIKALGPVYFYLGLGAILLFLLIRAYLTYTNFQFKIDQEHFILKKGILKKTNTAIPFHRIQNINFKQNIIQQIIGVFEVSIETAGSSNTEIAIKALSLSKAKCLKEIISKNSQFNKELLTNTELKPFVRIGFLELFKVSLTENHLQNLFLFLAILIGFFQQIQQIIDGLGKAAFLDGFIEESKNAVSTSILFIFISLILVVFIAFMSSFVKIFLVHFNLTAYLKEDAFEINQGLFTKKSIVLKKHKVQNITISTNPLKRLIGISFITFKQAVSGKLNKKKNKLIRIVGCKTAQVDVIKRTLFDTNELENKEKSFTNNYYKRRIFIFSFLIFMILYTVLYLVFNHIEILYSVVVVLPIVVFLILKKVEKRYYKITDSLLLVGKGFIETHLTYLELFKVQNIKLKQNIFQERSNIADLVFQTASGKIKIPCINYEDAVKIYNHTLYKVETSKTSWM